MYPPPLPGPPAAPQANVGPQGGVQGLPQGLSADPAAGNKAANIVQGLNKFLQSYLGAKDQQHQVYSQKVNDTMDSLASGRVTLDQIDQKQVAKWIKLSGMPIRTEAFSPEEKAYKQQEQQQAQLQQAVAQHMIQQGNQQMGPPIQGGLPPGVAPQQQMPPGPPMLAQPQAPQQQGGLKGFLQRVLNPARNASADSPAGELMQQMAARGQGGPQSVEATKLRNIVSQLATSMGGQQAMEAIAKSGLDTQALLKLGPALLEGPGHPDYFKASEALPRFGLASPANPMEMFMRLAKASYDAEGKSYTPEDLINAGFRSQVQMQMMGPMREELTKEMVKNIDRFGGVDNAYRAYFGAGTDNEKVWSNRKYRPDELEQMSKTLGNNVGMLDPHDSPSNILEKGLFMSNIQQNPALARAGIFQQSGIGAAAPRNEFWKEYEAQSGRMHANAAGLNAQSNMSRAITDSREFIAKQYSTQIAQKLEEYHNWQKAGKEHEQNLALQDLATLRASANASMAQMGMSGATNPFLMSQAAGVTSGLRPEGRGTYPHEEYIGGVGVPQPSESLPEMERLQRLIDKSSKAMQQQSQPNFNDAGSANR